MADSSDEMRSRAVPRGRLSRFAAFGRILSCKVAANENGSLGYGFVHYETNEAADAAIKHVNGMLLNDKKVYVAHHISKKDRQAKICLLYTSPSPRDS